MKAGQLAMVYPGYTLTLDLGDDALLLAGLAIVMLFAPGIVSEYEMPFSWWAYGIRASIILIYIYRIDK